jgi:hypothetical protein
LLAAQTYATVGSEGADLIAARVNVEGAPGSGIGDHAAPFVELKTPSAHAARISVG